MKEKPWNRCDECGRFVPLASFGDGSALRELVTPDSAFTRETYRTLCVEHAREYDRQNAYVAAEP